MILDQEPVPEKDISEEPDFRQRATFDRRSAKLICAMIALITFFTVFVIGDLTASNNDARIRHETLRSADLPDLGLTPPAHLTPGPALPRIVGVGCYVDRIIGISVKDQRCQVEFYLWLTWRGAFRDPTKSLVVVDGSIDRITAVSEASKGEAHYKLLLVEATITKAFDTTRFPCDDDDLLIEIENQDYTSDRMVFQADAGSEVSSRVNVPGYKIYSKKALGKLHVYHSRRGDPRLLSGTKPSYSQFRYVISIRRPGWWIYAKLFIGLYVAVGVAMLALFVRPTHVDPRFGLGIAALFGAIANTYVTASLTPDATTFTLVDYVNGFGIFFIFVTLVQSAVSLHWSHTHKQEASAIRFDHLAFWSLLLLYLLINIALPYFATNRSRDIDPPKVSGSLPVA